MANDISKYDDVIDSRDVVARIEELREERDDLQSAIDEALETYQSAVEDMSADEEAREEMQTAIEEMQTAIEEAESALQDWTNENGAELAALEALAEEASGYAADWHHGEPLIRYSYFKEYSMALADDIGAIPHDSAWPLTCIDWDQAAEELKMDYSVVDFDGVEYFIR